MIYFVCGRMAEQREYQLGGRRSGTARFERERVSRDADKRAGTTIERAMNFADEAERDAFLREIEAEFASRRFTNSRTRLTRKAYVVERAADIEREYSSYSEGKWRRTKPVGNDSCDIEAEMRKSISIRMSVIIGARCRTCATAEAVHADSFGCRAGSRRPGLRKCAKIVGEVLGKYHPHAYAGL